MINISRSVCPILNFVSVFDLLDIAHVDGAVLNILMSRHHDVIYGVFSICVQNTWNESKNLTKSYCHDTTNDVIFFVQIDITDK